MKTLLLITATICLFSSCHKSASNPQDYPHLSSSQIWDSIGFKYEKKYWIAGSSISGNLYPDTIVVHSNNTITETFQSYSINYAFNYRAVDTILFDTTVSFGVTPYRRLLLYCNQISDTSNHLIGYLHRNFIQGVTSMYKQSAFSSTPDSWNFTGVYSTVGYESN